MTAAELNAGMTLALYGQLMLCVQVFEQNPGFLWMWHQIGEEETPTPRNMQKAMARMIHVTHRSTAKELRNGLEQHLDPPMVEEITRLIAWRDVLAHRYLRERFRPADDEGPARFADGTHAELAELLGDFTAAAAAREQRMDEFAEKIAWDLPNWSPEAIAAIEDVARRILQTDPENE